jgi:outer membrane scaffolding protein for murein synthesis (MipA/OmpV family)
MARLTAFAEYVLVPFGGKVPLPIVLRADVRRAIGGYDGVVGDFSGYMPVYGGAKFFVLVGPSITYANTPFMKQFFGVAPGQAQAFGVPPFNATGGFKSWAFGANAIWMMSEHWRLDITGAWTRLIGDAAGSPTTERRNQYAFSLSLDYAWSRK